jgi:hypothetical protein
VLLCIGPSYSSQVQHYIKLTAPLAFSGSQKDREREKVCVYGQYREDRHLSVYLNTFPAQPVILP